ncbi:hypothetical protein KKA23_01370 [Patescibacteria group bacterium]|nr:hypothetical protein [Patescibacteria group bacterium]
MKKTKLQLKDKPIKPIKKLGNFTINPRKISSIVFVLFLILVAWYFSREIRFLTAAPNLDVDIEDMIVREESFNVLGRTDSSAHLVVNDKEILVEKNGNFETQINLVAGVNLIKIKAKNRFGKTNEIIKRIIYEK